LSKAVTGFFAHPSAPAELVETIGTFIEQINGTGLANLFSWVSLNTTGKSLVTVICEAIDERDLFLCDLTIPNANVLFELGYAIARGKRVWITLNTTYPNATANYRQLEILTTIGYARYHNSRQLGERFYDDRPYERLQETIYHNSIEKLLEATAKPGLFYLKSAIDTDASERLTNRLKGGKVPLMVYDPEETGTEPLVEYIQRIHAAVGVVAHFVDDNRIGNSLQNAKYSLIAGLAYGLKKPLLMLAHEPFATPLDYKNLLATHGTAAACERAIEKWLPPIAQAYAERLARYNVYQLGIKKNRALQDISIGTHVAEDEEAELAHYFVSTAQYREALSGPRSAIFVGRKGTGKSANFTRVAAAFAGDKRYHVCEIRPVGYELAGLTKLLRQDIPVAERGMLIQAIWRFLIYTELAGSLCAKIESYPSYASRTAEEQALMDFVAGHSALINNDFAERIRRAVSDLEDADVTRADVGLTARITAALHERILGQLRGLLGRVLEKRDTVYILVDNLDKTWGEEADLAALTDFLKGLLESSAAITEEFRKTGAEWRAVEVSLLVFLRSDIFDYVMSVTPERDKLQSIQIDWTNPNLLYDVIEKRFISSVGPLGTPEEVWVRFFTPSIGGMATKEYLVTRIIPRPRDLIFWCKTALNNAINSRHERIEEDDILQAERVYSRHATDSLVTETIRRMDGMEAFIYEFAGAGRVLTYNQIRRLARKVGIPDAAFPAALDLLRDLAFLGVETRPGVFSFIYDKNTKPGILGQARTLAAATKERRYAVNVPYQAYLGITVEEEVGTKLANSAPKSKPVVNRRR